MAQTCLPPGFRFHPTDVELVSYYLKRKIMGKKLLVQAISEVELYKFAPWDLPDKSCLRSKDLEWFFFCPRDKKYPNGSRTNRGTPNGYWKTSGKDRTIELNSRIVGSKKTLIFHEGKAPKGNRTDWVMYEYKMEDDDLVSAGFSKDAYVLCKIFKKSGLGPRIGEQYGAPFNENEWENADAATSMFPLMSSSEFENSAEDPHIQHAGTGRAVDQPPAHHSYAACAQKKSSSEHVTADHALQELPSQQSVKSAGDGVIFVNNRSYEDNNVYNPPEIDGSLLEELSRFLNDSPRRDSPVGEQSGLPPMSEAEAQAFEVNTCDLYNELAVLAGLGGVSDVDHFCASSVDITDQTFHPTYSELASSDDYLELDDLIAPGATFTNEFPVPSNDWQYHLDQFTYNGHYDVGDTLSSTFAVSDSHPTMLGVVDDLPTVTNHGDFATDLVDTNYPDPTMPYPFS